MIATAHTPGIPKAAGFFAALLLAGCAALDVVPPVDVPESPEAAAAPWPRLADTPPAPPVGSPGVPDPAQGAAIAAELGAAAREAAARAAALEAPILTPAERRRLGLE